MPTRKFDPRILPITTAVATALLAGACGPSTDRATSDVAVCRDGAGRRTADANCSRGMVGHGGGSGWYYLGRGSAVPREGAMLEGGSTAPRAGVGYARASSATVSRGGFGGSAHAGGAGE